MNIKTTVFLFAVLSSVASTVMAGPIGPTWAESVIVNTYGGVSTTSTVPVDGGSFGVANFFDARARGGTDFLALVDYQGAEGSMTLNVTSASWGSGVSYPLTLSISSYPSSAAPPQLVDPPIGSGGGGGGSWDIPAGDYSSSPFQIGLGGSQAGDGVCFLLETFSDTSFGAAFINFSMGPSSVPEPSGFVLASIASLACMSYGLIRRRASS